MGLCMTCGNEYHNTFTVHKDHENFEFDSFECAIHALAPRCGHCKCPIIGQGVELEGTVYCGNHCLREERGSQTVIEIERFVRY